MHDPHAVAFKIKYPWKDKPSKLFPNGYRNTFITIWHVDPEKDGSDNSCGWYLRPRHLLKAERDLAVDLIDNDLDNVRLFFPSECERTEMINRVELIFCALRNHIDRRWWQHPRWHFWHWKLQIHPLQKLRRFLFSRCCRCGKKFSWGYSPISDMWDRPKVKLFRSEVGVYHHDCNDTKLNSIVQQNGDTANE